MKRLSFLVCVTVLLMGMAADLPAFTYSFHNKTTHPIQVVVEVYEGESSVTRIEPGSFHSVSTDKLLKSWAAEIFADNRWERILHLTCDFLPGDHEFSVHVQETTDQRGAVKLNWYSMGK